MYLPQNERSELATRNPNSEATLSRLNAWRGTGYSGTPLGTPSQPLTPSSHFIFRYPFLFVPSLNSDLYSYSDPDSEVWSSLFLRAHLY